MIMVIVIIVTILRRVAGIFTLFYGIRMCIYIYNVMVLVMAMVMVMDMVISQVKYLAGNGYGYIPTSP